MKTFSINIPKISIGTERDFTQEIPTNTSLNSDSEVKTINSMIQDPAQQIELTEVMDSNTSTTFVITTMEPRALFTDKLEESQEKDVPLCSSDVVKMLEEQDSTAQTEEMELQDSTEEMKLVNSCIETPMILAEENKEPVTENVPSTIAERTNDKQHLNNSTPPNILEIPTGAETSIIDDGRPSEGISQQEMGHLTNLITDIGNESSSNPCISDEAVN